MPPTGSSNLALAATLANAAIAVAKLMAAAMTGSAAILAEAVHSIAAAPSQALLLLGLKRAARPPHPRHPMRYVRELRFWTSVAPILLYSLGAGVAISEGIGRQQRAQPLTEPSHGYVVLVVALLVQAAVAHRAWRQLQKARDIGHPVATTVALETKAALAGLCAALAGAALSHGLGWSEADALASIAVGLIMGAVAALAALESKALLVGEAPTHLSGETRSSARSGAHAVVETVPPPNEAAAEEPAATPAFDPIVTHVLPHGARDARPDDQPPSTSGKRKGNKKRR